MNALLLTLHLIPISTPPSIDRNSAMGQILWGHKYKRDTYMAVLQILGCHKYEYETNTTMH